MKKLLVVILILIQTLPVWADVPKYSILFADGTTGICYVINNDIASKRIQLQYENDDKRWWISYYSIRAIVDEETQKDVTEEFIKPSLIPSSPKMDTSEPQLQQGGNMSSGSIVLISIAGTFLLLILLGALVSR